jgi:hypothetical protein
MGHTHTYTSALKRQTSVHWSCIHPCLPYSASLHALCSVSSFFFFCKKRQLDGPTFRVLLRVCVCVCSVHSGLFTSKLQTCLAENHIMPYRSFRHTHACSLKRQTLVHWSCIHPSLPYSAAVHAVCSVTSFFLFGKENLTDHHLEFSCVCVCVCAVYSDVLSSKIQSVFAENQTMPNHTVYSDLFGSKWKYKPEAYQTVCGQYVPLALGDKRQLSMWLVRHNPEWWIKM